MKRKHEQATSYAGTMSGRSSASRLTPAVRAIAAAYPAESHLSHLIPLNPGEFRFEISVARVPRGAVQATTPVN